MRRLMALVATAIILSLSGAGTSLAVTLQLTTTADISGASQDASDNYYVAQGEGFDVEISVLNPSSSSESATSVEATISLPSGLSTTDSLTKTVSSSLSPGSSADTSWEVTGDVAGNYLGQIDITTQGTNTAQNEDSTGVLVKSPATIVGGVSCSASDSKVQKSGFSVTVTVQNLGDLEATGISVNLSSEPSDISISNPETISSIDGGESGSAEYSLTSSQSTTYSFTATVTSDNAGSDTAECSAETVDSLPNGYVCSSNSQCSSGCCSSSLCSSIAACESGDDDGSSGHGGTVTGGGPGPSPERNATNSPDLIPGLGVRNNTKLQSAIQKVLNLANMSEQAVQNLMALSQSISSEFQMQRSFRYADQVSTMSTTMSYQGQKKVLNFMLYDSVPKEFAQSSGNITVTAPGASVEVVEEDPEFLFTYPEVSPGDSLDITYSVDDDVSEDVIYDFSGEVYAQALEEPSDVHCVDGSKRCSMSDVQICQDGEWVYSETCEQGCMGGMCIPFPIPEWLDMTTLIIIGAGLVVAIVVVALLFTKGKKKPAAQQAAMRSYRPGTSKPVTPASESLDRKKERTFEDDEI